MGGNRYEDGRDWDTLGIGCFVYLGGCALLAILVALIAIGRWLWGSA